MNRNLWWKVILIIAVLVVFAVGLIPTTKNPEPIRLGLDLKGGTYLIMRVNTVDAFKTEVDQAQERLKNQAKEGNLPTPTTRRLSDTSFLVTPPAGIQGGEYEKIGQNLLPDYDVTRNDQGLVFAIKPQSLRALEEQTVAQAVETINNRVDALGVAEHQIAPQSGNRIVIQLPGVDDPARVKDIIKTTAQLQFRMVEGNPASTEEAVKASLPPNVLSEVDILPGDAQDQFGRVVGREYYPISKSVPVTGTDLKTARVQKGEFGNPTVGFSLTGEGSSKFGALTAANVNRRLAIVLDNKVVSAPTIQSRIDDEGVITGQFSQQEAADLALVLRSGSLPASMTTLEERTVGPSLGRDSIREGILASLIGFALVIIAVIAYYKGAGINAILALILNLIILLGVMAYFRELFTLTLPGITGIILTLGMAVDSNVLVFERIKEELRDGKSVRAAIENGFQLAFGTIIDTHLTTIIAALFLFQFGTGPVKGFAVTLMIGLGASVFTAFFVSRVIFDIVYSPARRPTRISI